MVGIGNFGTPTDRAVEALEAAGRAQMFAFSVGKRRLLRIVSDGGV